MGLCLVGTGSAMRKSSSLSRESVLVVAVINTIIKSNLGNEGACLVTTHPQGKPKQELKRNSVRNDVPRSLSMHGLFSKVSNTAQDHLPGTCPPTSLRHQDSVLQTPSQVTPAEASPQLRSPLSRLF